MMDIPIYALQVIGILIWIGVMVPALLLFSNFFLLILFLVDLLMAENADQYDPRAQAMEEVHFDWRCIVALSPLHLEQQHLPGTESVYFDLDNTP